VALSAGRMQAARRDGLITPLSENRPAASSTSALSTMLSVHACGCRDRCATALR